MSPFPSFLNALRRDHEPAAPPEPAENAETAENDDDGLPVFDLLPPQPVEEDAVEADLADSHFDVPPAVEAADLGRNVHTIGISDIGRLSIDNDGRLYWDGKPVEVQRRILMSRRQVLGATLIAVFVVIGALGAAIQGATAARDWACRLGWTSQYCLLPGNMPRNSLDIPA